MKLNLLAHRRLIVALSAAMMLAVACGTESRPRQLTPTSAPASATAAVPVPTPPLSPPGASRSSDDRARATATAEAAGQGIYRYDADTRKLTRISDAAAYELAWLPEGEALWYSTATHPLDPRDPTSRDIRRLDLATGSDTRVFELGGGGWVGLAPVAGNAVFARFVTGRDYEIDLFEVGTGERRIGEGSYLRLSTDGALLAYVTPSCQGTPTLRILDLARAARSVPVPGLAANNIGWLPDDRLAVQIRRESGSMAWVVVDPVTAAVTPLSDVLGVDTSGFFSLSPDGKHVVLGEPAQAHPLILRNIAAGTESPLDVPGADGGGVWSPDSTRFVLHGEQALTIVSSDGAVIDTVPLAVVKGSGYYALSLQWSPDSKSLLFSIAKSYGVGVCD